MAESKKTMRILLLIGAVVLVGRGFWWFFVGGAPNEPEPRISNAIPRSASQRPTSLDKPTPPSRQVRRPVGAVGAPQLRDPELQEGKDTGGDPIVYGSDSSGILTALQSIRPDIKRCFDKSIREDGITGGRVSFEFRIEAQPDHPKNADFTSRQTYVSRSSFVLG